MKRYVFQVLLAGIAASALFCLTAGALEPQGASAVAVPGTPSASKTIPTGLSSGATDVLKLARAGVNDEVILAYIKNSSKGFDLDAGEIVYLRGEGVSNASITAMLNQRQTAAPVPTQQEAPAASAPQYAPTYTQPQQYQYPQPAPVTQPVSTVYVIPNTAAYSSYAYYPYSSSYYRYGYPSLSIGFGVSGWYGRGYWGGGYPGYYRVGWASRGYSYGGGYHGGHWGGGRSGGHHR
jgi:hypothetical protein